MRAGRNRGALLILRGEPGRERKKEKTENREKQRTENRDVQPDIAHREGRADSRR